MGNSFSPESLSCGKINSGLVCFGENLVLKIIHLDDLAESFFMSIFHNGRLRTMKANYSVAEGQYSLIAFFSFFQYRT
jgi:tRNA 2-thiocytidine biosynthesis protein TtcA